MTLDDKIKYLGSENFIKIDHADSFKNLNPITSSFLKKYGVYSNEKDYPYVTINNSLQLISSDYVKIGETDTGDMLCIDVGSADRIILLDDGELTVVNSSIKTYIECLYTLYYYCQEVERKNALGEYSVNRKKYAQRLLEMFNEIEGDIEDFPIWHVQVYERELGSL
jgi:hypothetical protein